MSPPRPAAPASEPAGPQPPRTDRRIGPWRHAIGVVVAAIPFALLSWLTHRALFVGNLHAATAAKALLAADRGRIEVIGFSYPPLPLVVALPRPTPLALGLAAAAVAGVIVWMLWRSLAAALVKPPLRILLVASILLGPGLTFIATQSFAEILALLLICMAWARYQRFVVEGATWNGFAAGLILGVAFFVNLHALTYAILFAMLAPLYASTVAANGTRKHAVVSSAVVVLFPALIAFASWAYLNWLFTGDPLRFLSDPAAPIRATGLVEGPRITGALRATGTDLLHVPLYLLIGVLVAARSARQAIVYVAPVALIAAVRMLGFAYPEAFAIATCSVVALAALPSAPPRAWRAGLAIVAAAQLTVGLALPRTAPETHRWHQVLRSGSATTQDRLEQSVAGRLAGAGPQRILADDRSAYRLIARAGTARPFLLPADSTFEFALSAPDDFVDYVLVAGAGASMGDVVSARYGRAPPTGFIVDAEWPGGTLYRRALARSLFVDR